MLQSFFWVELHYYTHTLRLNAGCWLVAFFACVVFCFVVACPCLVKAQPHRINAIHHIRVSADADRVSLFACRLVSE